MKTLTKLTLTTVAAMTLGATALLAGPAGPYGPLYGNVPRPAREVPAAAPMKCDRMTVNQNPKLGGTAVVACNEAIKDTLACRMACR
jgi:hypothetical protein